MPKEHIEALGTSKKPPVHVKVNDYEYTSTVAVMSGMYLIPFAKEPWEKSHIQGGDAIDVELTLIEGQRHVEIPEVLLKYYLNKIYYSVGTLEIFYFEVQNYIITHTNIVFRK